MAIGKGIKAALTTAKNTAPTLLAGTGVGATLATLTENANANPNIVVVNQTPVSETQSTASEGTYDWVAAIMKMNGSGGYNGQSGMGGNDTDNPRVTTTNTNTGLPIIPVLLIGAALIIGAVVLFGKKKKKGRK